MHRWKLVLCAASIGAATLCALTPTARAEAPPYAWSRAAQGSGIDSVSAVVDGDDDVIAFGGASSLGALAFDPARGFVAKLDAYGRPLWSLQPDSTWTASVTSAAVDRAGDIVLVGRFRGDITLGGRTLVDRSTRTVGTSDGWLALLDPSGTPLWLRYAGYPRAVANKVAVGDDGSIVLAGNLDAPGDFGAVPVAWRGMRDGFVAHLTSDGTPVWVRTVAGDGEDDVRSVAVDHAGNTVAVGYFTTEGVVLGATALAEPDETDGFVAHLGPDGALHWLDQLHAEASGIAGDVAVTSDDALVVTAAAARSAVIGGTSVDLTVVDPEGFLLTSPQPLVIKIEGGGHVDWFQAQRDNRAETLFPDIVDHVAIGPGHEIFVVGAYGSEARIDGIAPGIPSPQQDALAIRYEPDGSFGWMRRLTNADPYGEATSVALDGAGNLVVAGRFRNVGDFDGVVYTVAGSYDLDAFLGKLGTLPPLPDGHHDDDALSWTVTPWMCPYEIRRALDDPNLECPGIFQDDAGPRAAEKTWSLRVDDLTLLPGSDADFFDLVLPDPADGTQGGDPDIRPDDIPYRMHTVAEPLRECWVTYRQELGPYAWPREVAVTTHGSLTLRVVPTANDLTPRPVSGPERIHLYRTRGGADETAALGTGTILEERIDCPRSDPSEHPTFLRLHADGTVTEVDGAPYVPTGKDLRELIVSFGERDDVRSLLESGGYTLEAEYKIEAERDVPEWVDDENLFEGLPALPCLGAGFGGAPMCVGVGGAFDVDLAHPLDPMNPCLADGPDCTQWLTLAWPATLDGEPIDMTFSNASGVDIELYGRDQQWLAGAVEQQSPGEKRLLLQSPPEGRLLLRIRGLPATLGVHWKAPSIRPVATGDTNLDGKVDSADAKPLLAHVTFHALLAGVRFFAGDLDKNAHVDDVDLVLFSQKYLKASSTCSTDPKLLDVDHDGKETPNDALCVGDAVEGDKAGTLSSCAKALGPFDVDKNGKVDLGDLACVARAASVE